MRVDKVTQKTLRSITISFFSSTKLFTSIISKVILFKKNSLVLDLLLLVLGRYKKRTISSILLSLTSSFNILRIDTYVFKGETFIEYSINFSAKIYSVDIVVK